MIQGEKQIINEGNYLGVSINVHENKYITSKIKIQEMEIYRSNASSLRPRSQSQKKQRVHMPYFLFHRKNKSHQKRNLHL